MTAHIHNIQTLRTTEVCTHTHTCIHSKPRASQDTEVCTHTHMSSKPRASEDNSPLVQICVCIYTHTYTYT